MALSTFSRRPPTRSVQSFPSSTTSRRKDNSNFRPVNSQTTLARRLLFPQLPSDAELPSLLASSSLPPGLHAELYDFIALALRAFVNPWWTKITRYDKEFLVQINRVLTVAARSLEARISSTDLSALVFLDLPSIITQHYVDYRLASFKLNTSYSSGGAASLPQLFHQFQPHMAISSGGQINEDYIRQCVDFILKACLPPEDYDPDTERYIIREIVLKAVLDIIPKLSQPWFLHRLTLDILEDDSGLLKPLDPGPKQQHVSFHVIVVFILSAIQSVSGFCLILINGYKQALQTIKQVNNLQIPHRSTRIPAVPTNVSSNTLSTPLSQSSDSSPSISPVPSLVSPPIPSTALAKSPPYDINNYRDYSQPTVKLISAVFGLQNRFASAAMLNTVQLITAASSSFLDKLLPYMLYKRFLSPARLIDIVKLSKKALFPNGYLAPPSMDPTLEEQGEIRERLVWKIGEVIPSWLSPILLGPKTKRETIDGILNPLSSPECNIHLILFILDAILMRVVPELGNLTDVSLVEPYVASVGHGSGGKDKDEKPSATGKVPLSNSEIERSVSAGSGPVPGSEPD